MNSIPLRGSTLFLFSGLLLLLAPTILHAAAVHHDIAATLEPDSSVIKVSDAITFGDLAHSSLIFELHEALEVSSSDSNVLSLQAVQEASPTPLGGGGAAIYNRYLVKLKDSSKPFTLTYQGAILPAVDSDGEVVETTGVINKEGIFLARSSRWFPVFPKINFLTFRLAVTLPKGWKTISQGNVSRGGTAKPSADSGEIDSVTFQWQEEHPQDDIYLIAARFHAYIQQNDKVQAQVLLREADEALAQKYLDATGQYIEMYSRLLGDYPYQKFALVENFWETGYGMPSFTLLGSKVLRFPFILYTSYPHEILHNWWGNSVYIDYDSGNWAEGLTAYLADHLMKEQRGQARLYRRGVLQKYTDHVKDGDDFPLSEFRSRHNADSAAIGYGKTAMLFHMLRLELGERVFVKSLRQLYKEQIYKITSFADIQRIFSENADQDLKPYFNQWTQRSGAPELSVVGTAVKNTAQGYELSMTLAQTQAGKPYRLYVPVVISLQDSSEPFNTAVVLSSAQETFSLPLAARPIRIDVDPGFDIFRRLDVREIPSALSQGFGAEKPLIVLPSKARQALLTAYKKLALDWQKNRNKNISIILDSDLAQLPGNRTVWLLGWENRFIDVFKKSTHKQIEVVSSESASIAGHTYDKKKHSLVVTARQAQNIEHSLLWVATDNVAAITGLGRKLPHYGKYSYLAFEGDAPTNIAKGQWSVGDSPLAKQLDDGGSAPPSWVARAPLVSLPPLFSKQRMMKDISYLASKELKGRELGSKGLDQAAKYIAGEFKKAGLLPGGDAGKSFYQEWQQDVGKPRGKVTLKNVIAVLPGSNPGLQKQSLVISAHYDHLGQGWPNVHAGDEGKIHYGADDNASGVAVMLEFARQVAKKWRPERAIVFIAFTGEESALMGSDFYIKHAQQYPAKNVSSVLNLDMVGRLDDKPLTIFGVGTASELVHVFRGIGYVTGIKLNSVANDIGSSDHTRFVDIGVPGVQFFSGVHSQFHRPGDTVNKIDADGLVKVARVLKESAEYLANRIEPLTIKINAQLAKFPASTAINSRNSRKVRLGTIPDFAYQGTGVRIDGVSANSPAANAGLKAGDILLGINGSKIADLSSMSRALGALNAGEEIKVDYKRAGKPAAVTVRVDNR